MLLLAALAMAASAPDAPPPSPTAVSARARASVRILSAVRVDFSPGANATGPVLRDAVVRIAGQAQPARLVEFE